MSFTVGSRGIWVGGVLHALKTLCDGDTRFIRSTTYAGKAIFW